MGTIEESWEKNASRRANDMLEYQNWFDSCNSIEECISNGFIDFSTRVLTSDLYKHVGDPRSKVCLEIGHGGGRLMNAAGKFFKFVYGVDILNDKCMQLTEKFLRLNSTDNFKLVNYKNINIIEDNSIDFVYSFIVFQHLDSWKKAEKYLRFCKRVLKSGGSGIIYFGKSEDEDIVVIDKSKFKSRECSLYISEKFARSKISKLFEVIEVGQATKKAWLDRMSGQLYVKFKMR